MINLQQIIAGYPKHLQGFKQNIVREYLQYKILSSIYNSTYANQLIFLGGTALRIAYNGNRFSEDLDFDNLGLSAAEFEALGVIIKKDLELEGLTVEVQAKLKNAFRLEIKIPEVLYTTGLSPLPNQKILIQVDTVPQNFTYTPVQFLVNKFEVFTHIHVVDKHLLLAQKLYAACNRPRAKGRDFYDIVYLYSIGATPNYEYLTQNIQVGNVDQLKKYLREHTSSFNFAELAKDVAPFLMKPEDAVRVKLFTEFIETI